MSTMVVDSLVRSDLVVDGMTCGACSSRVERSLSELDGVSDSVANFATGRVSILHSNAVSNGDVAAVIDDLGYVVVADKDEQSTRARRESELWQRLVVAVLLTTPAVVLSMVETVQFSGWRWVVGLLATPVIFWSGWSFHRSALVNSRHRSTTMDTLVSLGSVTSWLWSATVLIGSRFDVSIGSNEVYFETGAVIITFILAGKWMEAKAKRRSGDAIRALADLGVKVVRLEDGSEIDAAALFPGMRIVVKPGEKVATDGVVVDGRSSIDQSMITGEPVPIDVSVGDEVVGGTTNLNGSLVVEARSVGADTVLAQIIDLVDQAQTSKTRAQRLADRVSAVFVPVSIAVAAMTLIGWVLVSGDADRAFTAAVTVLVIACPCALGLATPLAIMVGTGRGAQLGLIIKGGEVLEDTRDVDVVVFDKTGTMTEGQMRLERVLTTTDSTSDADSLLVLAASVESLSEHPIGTAVADGCDGRRNVDDFSNSPGVGVTGLVGGDLVGVGKRSLFDEVPAEVEALVQGVENDGVTGVLVGRNGTAEAVLVISDRVKPTAGDSVKAVKDQGMSVVLLTGDNRQTADAVAAKLGIGHAIAGVLPSEKAGEIRRLQNEGARVAMVGDGINDAPALAQADLGIAVGTGTDVAIEASDITIIGGDPLAVADAIALSRRTLATIKGNLFWAFIYNTAAIPVAALGYLNPMIAAGTMGLSSLFVATNSLRLRSFKPHRLTASSN